jgi:hypothetical protein
VEAGANAPPKSRLQVTFGGCENDRLRINHTMHMPAKIGPKRVRALARAGCYFDSSAATCGAELLDWRRKVTAFVQSRSCPRVRVFSTLRTLLRKYLGTEHVSASQLVPPDVNDQVEQRDRDDDRRDEDQRLSVR